MNQDLEIKLLKDTILALREELEKARIDEEEHLQQAVSRANEELRQLKTSVVELREQLEFQAAQHEEKLRISELHHEREKSDLKKTITMLREKIEELNESLKKTRASSENSAAGAPR